MNKSIYSTFIPTSATTLASLSDVSITTPSNGEVLTYNAGTWSNSAISPPSGVSSFNSRTGSVLPASNDYSISQITNASTLANASNVSITSPQNGQVLTYDSSTLKFRNLPQSGQYYPSFINDYTGTVTASPNTFYKLSAGGTLTIPPFAEGQHILIETNANFANITFSGTSFVINSYLGGGTVNPTFSMNGCTLELICSQAAGQTYYEILRISITRPNGYCTLNGTKISSLISINNIPDVSISSPINNQALVRSGTSWINANIVNSFNGRIGAVSPTFGDYALTTLSDVSISTPLNGQILQYNGSAWLNSTFSGVTSFNSRTGNVLPAAGDYSLSLLSDVDISTATATQGLIYNGTKYISQYIYDTYTSIQQLASATITASLSTLYFANSSVITAPTTAYLGARFRVFNNSTPSTTTVVFPAATLIAFQGSLFLGPHSFTTTSYSSLEAEAYNITGPTPAYRVSLFGTWTTDLSTKNVSGSVLRIDDASNVTITSIQPNQILSYNGTNWINSYPLTYYYLNSTGNLNSGQYIYCSGQSGNISATEKIAAHSFYITRIIIHLTNSPGILGSRTFTVYKNGAPTSMSITLANSDNDVELNTNNVSGVQFDRITIRHTATLLPNAAIAMITFEYRPL